MSGTDLMGPALKDTPWTFADFPEGEPMAEVAVELNNERAALWAGLYGGPQAQPGEPAPRGLAVAAMMEAYIRAIQPRPPGNVHAGQTLSFFGKPTVGAVLTARFTVVKKEIKKERRWLTLGVEMFDGDDKVLAGEILSIWAA